jgi:hypothetical protein
VFSKKKGRHEGALDWVESVEMDQVAVEATTVAAELAVTLSTPVRYGTPLVELMFSTKSPTFMPSAEPFEKNPEARTSVLVFVDLYVHSAGVPPMLGTRSCGGAEVE